LPGHAQIRFSRANAWEFPEGTVLVQSLGLELERDRPGSRRWIETRILLLQDKEWAGYSYRWNDQQTDAELLPSSGDDREFTIREGRKIREQTWLYPSRTDCLTCHSRAAHFILGLNTAQLNRTMEIAGATTNQIGALFARGVLKPLTNELNFSNLPKLANPYASEANRAERVHAYLRINCSHCHTDAGGGNSAMEMRAAKLEEMRLIGVLPQHDTFELPQARIIAPGHPERSVLLHRISQRGYGRMPPLSITTVDEQAVELFKEWIRELQDPVK
jgi:mono/diheme cytochrome c family protein